MIQYLEKYRYLIPCSIAQEKIEGITFYIINTTRLLYCGTGYSSLKVNSTSHLGRKSKMKQDSVGGAVVHASSRCWRKERARKCSRCIDMAGYEHCNCFTHSEMIRVKIFIFLTTLIGQMNVHIIIKLHGCKIS